MLDYHVHLWPHPERAEPAELRLERLARYCDTARENGVEEIALTEHLFRFTCFNELAAGFWRDAESGALRDSAEAYFAHHVEAELDAYVEAVLEAKSAGLPVVLGLEVDYLPTRMEAVGRMLAGYPFDVLLGSVHWIGAWLFDDLDDAVSQAEWERRDVARVWSAYAEAVAEMAASGACDVLAHPDLVKLTGRRPSPAAVEECHGTIAEAARASGVAAEISSAGLRKPAGEAYPAPELLRAFFLAGVPVTTASDSHGPALVGSAGTELAGLARAAGYGSLRAFSSRRGRDVPIGRPGEPLGAPPGSAGAAPARR